MAGEISESGGEARLISGINVTPFVDVVLVLLVIFMVTAPALMKDVFGIHLPKAVNADKKTDTSFGVAITEQGQILLNGQLTDEASLLAQVKTAFEKDKNTQILVSADANSRHADLVHVIDVIKGLGVTRFALQIQHQQ